MFVSFCVFELALADENVETDFILTVVPFPNLLPIFLSSVARQASQAILTVVSVFVLRILQIGRMRGST